MADSMLGKFLDHLGLSRRTPVDIASAMAVRQKALTEISDELLSVTASRIKSHPTELRRRFKGSLYDNDLALNGYVAFERSGAPAFSIHISNGLTHYFHQMSKLWASSVQSRR